MVSEREVMKRRLTYLEMVNQPIKGARRWFQLAPLLGFHRLDLGFPGRNVQLLLKMKNTDNLSLLTRIKRCLGDIGSESFSDRVADFPALVDDHLDDEAQVCHFQLCITY